MKCSIVSLSLMAISTLAAPTMTSFNHVSLPKRAALLEDVASTGYATLNGGTKGGKGGKTIEVASLSELATAVKGDAATIVLVTGPILGNGENVKIGSNKSVIGKDSSVILTGFTLTVKNVKNVIIRNLAITKVVGGDAIAIQVAQNVWIDHVNLSSDRDHDKDHYDGLLDITHAGDYVTVSNTVFHDHWKCSLVGHSDNNGSEDKGHLRVTYHNNYWYNINSRGPSFRFGTGHLYNNYYENVSDGVNTRQGAQLLVQNNVFSGSKKPLYSTDSGYAVASGNDLGGGQNTASVGTLTKVPYDVSGLLAASAVKATVVRTAGATLVF
ncbi:polysaccharide lyase family 1 protein [Cucurbitaria berberidis CBS 394.84]|uniref:pectate lyase n=1 Tax=Cucurbitaria berberidis CBS 394.84 TaxID=1168544 RepID=A0A9P4GG38_9PLEO|nr:polysaccharide lyase family 1 protein [Cucurbitaria berberidis CBS 394.84]KAF1844616.1 polysaccharide lyase family 1 protein [Cucurbitaria berberidis CBS 394.84]